MCLTFCFSQGCSSLGYSSSDGVRQQFTQKEQDVETGLDYFLARYFSSVQGRFTSPDEFKGEPSEVSILGDSHPAKQALGYADGTNPQSLNKYQYTFNNPLRYLDPTGQTPQDSFELNFSRDVKDLMEKRITEEEFRSRMNARGAGAAVGAAIVAAYLYGPSVATAILVWATRNPDKVEQIANVVQETGGGPPSLTGGATSIESAATKLEGIVVNKAVNSDLAHAATRAVERGVFSTQKEAAEALRALSKEITANGLPAGSMRDTAHADRVLVPLRDGSYAVYQILKNGTARLKTVLLQRN